MMKRGKAGCKRVLCWLLTAAMVMTGSSVPGLETKAASATNTVTQTAEGEESSTGTEIKETESEGISEEDSREEISAEESSEEETLSEEPSSDHTQEETSKEDDSEPESETKSAEEETETEIMLLQEDETAESIEATLYYYIGKTDKEVGVVAWNDKVSYGDTAAKAEWTPWTGTDCYLMTKLEYAGWYSIDLVFADAQTASGFEIFTAAKSEDGTYAPGSSSIYKCSKEYEGNEVYAKLISKESSSYAVKGDKLYTDIDDITILQRNITLYVYDKEGTPAIMASQPISAVDETTGTISEMTADHTESWGYFYDMASDETASDWYYLTFSVPKADTGEKTCQLYQKTASDTYDWIKNFINGGTPDEWSVDITPVFSGNIYYKDGEFSDTRSTTSGHEEQAEINVEKVALPDDFITGADLSSYISLVESGVVFKDKDGNALSDEEFFKAIADGGTNWVRIRVWDDPYDSNGNSYGGGHNDIETAIKIGKLATNAGMRVLIDFHYSDFWVDPAKYKAPKAWADMTVEQKAQALYDHTYDNLVKLHDAGVDVGMVQVGNETNNGIAGVTYANEADICSLFSAGSKAVRDYSRDCLNNESAVKVAVHFANPEKGFQAKADLLNKYKVDYDVFASSYYPYWHENSTEPNNTSSLTTALEYVATQYGKEVMVAETSWATTWDDGDGHENSAPRQGQNLQYDISVQGQADEMRAVVAAVNSLTNGIGVFYWEPAWIPVGYAYNDDGTVNEDQLNSNKEKWDKYGSGWASSYSADYDPDDAGKWYGGSAIDNQAWFDFDGTALPTLNVYRYIRTGAMCTTKNISDVPKSIELEVYVDGEIQYPETIEVKFNDGTKDSFPVKWDEEQQKLVSTDKTGEYVIDGVVTCEYNNNLADVVKKYDVTLTIKVVRNPEDNRLNNPGFENGWDSWKVTYDGGSEVAPTGYTVKPTGENPHSGSFGMNFWRGDAGIDISVSQEITGLAAGNYDFGGFIQGGSAGEDDLSYAYVKITHADGKTQTLRKECVLQGWQNWSQPEVSGFAVSEGDTVEVGFEIKTTIAGSWGSIDDLYLYHIESGDSDTDVEPKDISKATITTYYDGKENVDKLYYTGGEVVYDKVKVELDGEDITKWQGKGYILQYENNSKVGTAKLHIVADDNSTMFSGSQTLNFKIVKADLGVLFESGRIEILPIEDAVYTGKEIKPEVTIQYGTRTLQKNKDYTITYKNNITVNNNKKPEITIQGKGNFTGKINAIHFTIVPQDLSDSRINAKANAKTLIYNNGKNLKPSFTVTSEISGGLKLGRDYNITSYSFAGKTVDVKNNKFTVSEMGTYTVTLAGIGNYCGSRIVEFKVTDGAHSITNAKIEVTKKGVAFTGNEVSLTSSEIKVKDKQGNTLTRDVDYKLEYENNMNAGDKAKVTVIGTGKYAGEKTVFFKINKADLSKNTNAELTEAVYYTGYALKPQFAVKTVLSNHTSVWLEAGKDYTISFYNNVTGKKQSDGTYLATAKIKGKGNYTGTYTTTFVINPAGIDEAAVADIKVQSYKNGKEIKPALKVKVNGRTLKLNKDYTVTYTNNKLRGKAQAVITGIGNYSGTVTKNFTIK